MSPWPVLIAQPADLPLPVYLAFFLAPLWITLAWGTWIVARGKGRVAPPESIAFAFFAELCFCWLFFLMTH
jgi:hypothetical protein